MGIVNKSITIFDVMPFRQSYYQPLCNSVDYYNTYTVIAFFNDIAKICEYYNFSIYHKPKKINYLTDKKYIQLIKQMNLKNNYHLIDYKISAINLIEKSKFVISLPYTSTSLIAKHNNIETIFYDPLNIIKDDIVKSHGIKLISGFENLQNYMSKIFNY